MSDERVFQFDLGAEIDRYFDPASLPDSGVPNCVILMGGPASGKTTLRKQRYSTGYVVVDAVDIFLSLSRGESFDFPGPFEDLLNLIGPLVASRAIQERRNMVTELIGAEFEPVKALVDALSQIGYRVSIQMVHCDLEEAQRRNLSRGSDCISAYFSERFQRGWLHEAASRAQHCNQP